MADNTLIGYQGEMLALYRLAMHGIVASYVDRPDYDLVIETDSGLLRAQVKTRRPETAQNGYCRFTKTKEVGRSGSNRDNSWREMSRTDIMIYAVLGMDYIVVSDELDAASCGIKLGDFNKDMELMSLKASGLVTLTRAARDYHKENQLSIFDLIKV